MADNSEAIRICDPETPQELHDRAADNWRPLLAIADAAGGKWPKLARGAAITLTDSDDDAESCAVMLLADIRDLFDQSDKERVKDDRRFVFGVPKADNANYLWSVSGFHLGLWSRWNPPG